MGLAIDRSISFNFFENETGKKTIFHKIKEIKVDFGFLVISRSKMDKAVFHKEEIGEFKIDFGFLAINQFPVQFFRKKNPFSTKEKSERSKFVGFLAFDRFRVQYFRERKWKKGIFQEEESKLIGSNDRSISRAIQNFRREKENGKRVYFPRVRFRSTSFPSLGTPGRDGGCFFGGEYSSRGWTAARSSGSAADE